MNTRRCQTCRHWDASQRLERTSLGDLAPCTRSAPVHYNLASVLFRSQARLLTTDCSPEISRDPLGGLQIPVALWPYTDAAQTCGDYHPCDLEENARRNKLRAEPLV
jgi:hypothetical protein